MAPAAVTRNAAGWDDGREPAEPGAGGFRLGPAPPACCWRGDMPHSPELLLVGLGGGILLQQLFSAGQARLSASRICQMSKCGSCKSWSRLPRVGLAIRGIPFDSSHGIESIHPQAPCGRLWRDLSFQNLDIPLGRHRPSRPRTPPNSGYPSRITEVQWKPRPQLPTVGFGATQPPRAPSSSCSHLDYQSLYLSAVNLQQANLEQETPERGQC